MRRLLIALAALLLVLGVTPMAALASGDDDRSSSSGDSAVDDSGDTPDDSDGRLEDEDGPDDSGDSPDDSDGRDDDDDDSEDGDSEDGDEDEASDDDDDDDGHHQRRHRRRHRNRGGDDGDAAGGGGTGGRNGDGTTPPPGPAPSSATVEVLDDSFSPSAIRVAVGGTVTWSNVSREHTVTDDGGGFDSGVFDAGQTFEQTFATAGAFDYRCMIHPDMTGTVTVGDAATTAASGGASRSPSSASSGGSSGAPASAGTAGVSGLPALSGATVPPPLTAAAVDSADVEVLDFEFAPAAVTVDAGATVRWTVNGQSPHTVTGDAFDSGMLKPGDVYEQTFTDVGEVAYRCEFHPGMEGTVTVAAARTAAPPAEDAGGDTAGGSAGATDDAGGSGAAPSSAATGSALANSGLGGVPVFLSALAIILLGWTVLVTSRRRGSRIRA